MIQRLRGLARRLRDSQTPASRVEDDGATTGPPLRARMLVVIVAAMIAAAWAYAIELHLPGAWRDFDVIWVGGRALMSGDNPYEAVRRIGWPWPLYHPLPAVLVDLPFALLSRQAGRIAFTACSTAFFVFAVTRRALWPALFMFTAPYRNFMATAQLSPMLIAAALIPVVSGLLIIKPNIGLALFISRPSKWTAIGGAALVGVSLIVWPGWPSAWWPEASKVTHLAPILRPGGVLLLLGLLRVRQPEGRLLAALALIPHRPVAYDMLPTLVLVPKTWKQALFLGASSEVAWQIVRRLPPPLVSVDAWDTSAWPAFLAFVYIPALILVLLRPRSREWRNGDNV